MRRTIAVIAIIMCLVLNGCNGKTPPKKDNSSSEKPSSSVTVDSSDSSENTDDTASDNSEEDSMPEDGDTSAYLRGTVSVIDSNYGKNGSAATAMYDTQSGGYDSKAAILRKAICSSVTKYSNTGTTYYISPNGDDFNDGTSPENAWETTDALVLNSYRIQAGDAVLFERDHVYRANSTVSLVTGVTYGAYGKGSKPIINGSVRDYADSVIWEPSTKKNIWKTEFAQKDAGLIVFNGGKSYGIKKSGLASMKQNGDFYHNTEEKVLYFYSDKGNPGKMYDSMEIGTNHFLFTMNNRVHDVTIDNLCFRYTGAHAIDGFENNYDITIKNCEFGWIGGSMQNTMVRYGNAIQFWDSCWNIRVENNWIYQAYDAGVTFQYKGTKAGSGKYHDISFSNNLIEYCTYGIEIFTEADTGLMENITFDSNVIRFSSYGFGSQRPNSINDSHICAWNKYYGDNMRSFVIKNNVFDCSSSQIIDWASGALPHKGLTVSGNTFYQKAFNSNPVMHFGTAGYTYAGSQKQLENAVATFDPTPKLVKWIG